MNSPKTSNSQTLAIDWKEEQTSSLLLPKPPTLSSPTQILQEVGIGINCYSEPAHEVPESSSSQHIIVVGFSKSKVERRMDENKQIESLENGSTVLIPARVNHTGIAYDECIFALLLIEPKSLTNHFHEVINPDRFELTPTFAKPDPLIYGIAKSIKADFDSGNYDQSYVETLFHTLSVHLLKYYATKKLTFKNFGDGLPPYKLKQAIEYINDNLDQQIKLTDLAQLVDISQYYFCRLFQDSMGVSPYRYVIQQRIAKAKHLIKNSQLALSDIAYECGFSSQSQMTQHFRKCVGVTPKVYRNKL